MKATKRIIQILFAAFVLTMVPVAYASAQTGSAGRIESGKERQARLEKERKKKQQQEAAAKKKREEEARKKREEEARKKREAEERKQREAEERERMRPFRELEANMVYVEGGTFTMGATTEQGLEAENSEKPTHNVTLSSFHLCKYEVTQELWQAVMGNNPSNFKGAKLPVENVSWEDCQQFISKLNLLTGKNYRLPTEAEWEYAARGGNQSKGYKYSGSNKVGDVAWFNGTSHSTTHDVGTKLANELGLYDMSGNVWEWCSDGYGEYHSGGQTNPRGASSGAFHVLRGGNWHDHAGRCRVSFRQGHKPPHHNNTVGLRLAL